MYLAWTFFVAVVYPRGTWGAISAGPGRDRPPHGGGLQTVSTVPRGAAWGPGTSASCARTRFWPLPGDAALAHLARGGQGRLRVPCARTGALPGERAAGRAAARQAPGRRGNLPGTGSPATGRPVPGQPVQPACVGLPRCRSRRAAGRVPGAEAGNGQQNWQTV